MDELWSPMKILFWQPQSQKPSHKYPQRRGKTNGTMNIKEKTPDGEKGRPIFVPATSLFVGRSPTAGDAPSSRLVVGPNLWPRHLRLFMR
jgi:hypothetical protein